MELLGNMVALGFPGGVSGKEHACQFTRYKRYGSIPGSGRFPCRREWQPTPAPSPGKSHGQRNLADYSPWSHKSGTKLSTRAWMDIHIYIHYIIWMHYRLFKQSPPEGYTCVVSSLGLSQKRCYKHFCC